MDKAGASLNRYIMPPAAADDLFDHIDDLLDFPTDTADFTIPFPPIPTGAMDNPPQYLVGDGADSADPPPPNKNNNAAAAAAECYDDGMAGGGKGKRPPAPIADGDGLPPQSHNDMFEDVIDMADLEWLSNFMDDTADSFSLDFPVPPHMELDMDIKFEDNSLFRTPSPVSVLEHSGLVMATGAVAGAGAGAGGGVRSGSSSSASFSSSSSTVSSSGNSFNSDPIPAAFPAKARSKRARPRRFIGPFLALESPDIDQHVDKKRILEREEAAGVRKCTHCEIQKTPQWRAGPMGPKTLCNACGVRYKSGRLFPEYRPAASPTFVPAIHSNSHKKVVEMRIQTTPNSSSCDLLQYIRRSKEY